MKWLENRSAKDRERGENSRKNKMLSWRQEALGSENGVLSLKSSSPTLESEGCVKRLSRAYVGKQRQRKNSHSEFPLLPLCGIHAFFKNPLVLLLKHFLIERWRDLVLEITDMVFTYSGKIKITIRSEPHPTVQSRCLPYAMDNNGKKEKEKVNSPLQ